MITIRQHAEGPAGQKPFDLTDRGLLLGDGVFDTSRVVNGKILFMEEHLKRLLGDAAALGLSVDPAELRAFALDVIPDEADGALRLTITRGPGPRGLAPASLGKPTLIAKFDEGAPAFPMAPLRLMVSDIHRNPTAPSSLRKTLAYTDAISGLQRAKVAGFDEALYLTPSGNVACSSIANIVARFGDRLVTPPLKDGVVAGIMRAWLVRTAPGLGFEIDTASMKLAEVEAADALYLMNSLQLIRPVSALGSAMFDPNLPDALETACERLLEPAL